MSTEVTILMPCLNEAETLASCIASAKKWLVDNNISGEVLVADNGSTDGSLQIAVEMGARVVTVEQKGYGAAVKSGIMHANSPYVIMGDSDGSYNFADLNLFIDKLRSGFDLVIGNRFTGGIEDGAMPFLHKYIGNPILSGFGRLLFKCPVGDFYCGLRGFNQNIVTTLNLNTTGMEFASEMVIKATQFKLSISEVPTTLSCDGRSRPSHLRTWRDGWKGLWFMIRHAQKKEVSFESRDSTAIVVEKQRV